MKNDLSKELTSDSKKLFEEIASQLLLKAGNMLGPGKGYSAVARDDDVKSLREGRLTAPPAIGLKDKPAGDESLADNDDVDGSDDEKMSNKEIFASRRGRRGASSLTAALAAQQHIVQKDKSMVKGEGKKKAAADKLAAATAAAAAPAEEKDQKDLQKDVALW